MIPLFILGISPRCGTNYLFGLLSLHPDCVKTSHSGEDFIIYNSEKYLEFVNSVASFGAIWHNDPQNLLNCLEDGLVRYLSPSESNAKYVVAKTPQPVNANNFVKMFRKGYLILLVRRGQDIAESFHKTFNARFDDAVRAFSYGAKEVISVLDNPEMTQSKRVMFVKYEDLFTENKKTMTSILDFVGLDVNRYDFEKSASFDIIGSSQMVSEIGTVDWEPIEREKTFNPVKRSDHWSRWQHYRFNWIAGKYSQKLGYPIEYPDKSVMYYLYNFFAMIYDFCYRLLRKASGGRKAGWLK